ncbi:MAG TPA: serine hydrolase domain-containing protein [Thermomicrobiaceae bacterium]|nr:serine hydrolase domain-containing protein [Thermomicrobiaceae bacterium]
MTMSERQEATWAPEVRAFTREMVAAHAVPGLALAAARDGREVLAEGFGVRELGRPEAVTPDTVFGVASVTKSFTALAVMQLFEAGKLALDDPVTRYLPEFRLRAAAHGRAITLHHFLTHSAGLPPLPSRFFAFAQASVEDPHANKKPEWEADHAPFSRFEDLMDYLAEREITPLGPPGAQFSYCNEGFVLLGAIVERVSGEPYPDYIRGHILEPLGMVRSTFEADTLGGFDNVTTFHTARRENGQREVFPAPYWALSRVWAPAGDLNTSVRDLLRYLEIYRTDGVGGVSGAVRLLSSAGIARMTHPHQPTNIPGTFYGYGLQVTPGYHGVTVIQHGGGRKGIAANVLVSPEAGITAAAVANLDAVPSARVTLAALNGALGLPVDTKLTEHVEQPLPAEQLRRYVGNYRGGENQNYSFSVEDGSLRAATAAGKFAARPVGGHDFLLDTPGSETFARFLVRGSDPAWAVAAGSRIIPRWGNE